MVEFQLSLMVRGQHPPGDPAGHLKDDLDLVRRAEQLGFSGSEIDGLRASGASPKAK